MLIQEIGRFGDNVEELKPSDLVSEISAENQKGFVGIFWHVGENQFIIKKAPLIDDNLNAVEMGQDYDEIENPDDLQIDFNSFHKEIWNQFYKDNYKCEYDHFSRGRIVFNVKSGLYSIYIPNDSKFNGNVSSWIAEQFNLTSGMYFVDQTIYKKKSDCETLDPTKDFIVI